MAATPTSSDAAATRPDAPGRPDDDDGRAGLAPARSGDPAAPTGTDDLARVRTFTRWSLIFIGVMSVLLPLIDLAQRDDPAAARVAIVVVLLLVGAEQVRLLLGAMGATDARALRSPRVLAAGVAALVLLALPAPDPDSGSLGLWALPFAGLLGAAVLWVPAPRRRDLAVAGAVLAAVVGGTVAAIGDGSVAGAVIAAVVVVLFVAGADVLQMWIWDVTVRLDEARTTAGELAVLRERLRFSADLHDVQGHHLQAISLKAELTRRLIGTDDDAARGHAADVQELTLSALAETRALVRGYRKVGLVTELENAVQILRAAGVQTTITGTPERVPEALQPLFGALVREGATNLLRHAQAERCTLSVQLEGDDVVLRVEDDGLPRTADGAGVGAPDGGPARPGAGDGDDPGTGVVALRERFAAVGGRVEAAPLPGRGFALTGRAHR